MSNKVKSIEFKVIKEPWNRFELSDGTMLKSKYILKRIILEDDGDSKKFNFIGQPEFIVDSADIKFRREGIKDKDDDLTDDDSLQFVDFSIISEEWNRYEIYVEGTAIIQKFRLSVVQVKRFEGKYDRFGFPRYNVNHVLNTIALPTE